MLAIHAQVHAAVRSRVLSPQPQAVGQRRGDSKLPVALQSHSFGSLKRRFFQLRSEA